MACISLFSWSLLRTAVDLSSGRDSIIIETEALIPRLEDRLCDLITVVYEGRLSKKLMMAYGFLKCRPRSHKLMIEPFSIERKWVSPAHDSVWNRTPPPIWLGKAESLGTHENRRNPDAGKKDSKWKNPCVETNGKVESGSGDPNSTMPWGDSINKQGLTITSAHNVLTSPYQLFH